MAEENLLRIKQYLLSNDFFEKGYSSGNSPCTCTSNCCKGGVWTDVREHDVIMAHRELIRQQMDDTQNRDETTWFEKEVLNDTDFPSGKCIGTEIINDKCAFLDKEGRCSIQLAAVSAGKHKWTWKPHYCILYPVEVTNNVVGFDPMLQGEQQCCTVTAAFETPLFVACEEELTHLLGVDGYTKLKDHYAALGNPAMSEVKR